MAVIHVMKKSIRRWNMLGRRFLKGGWWSSFLLIVLLIDLWPWTRYASDWDMDDCWYRDILGCMACLFDGRVELYSCMARDLGQFCDWDFFLYLDYCCFLLLRNVIELIMQMRLMSVLAAKNSLVTLTFISSLLGSELRWDDLYSLHYSAWLFSDHSQ